MTARLENKTSRRGPLRGLGLASAAGAVGALSACTTSRAAPGALVPPVAAGNPPLDRLLAEDRANGGAAPDPIPWLDKNGSHNQMPGPGMEPSSIFHFKGRIARGNDFTGAGQSSDGERISFGLKSTDSSCMHGEYFAGRQARQGAFGHL